jgi:hypothetical protein
MEMSQVVGDLHQRIEQSRHWLDSSHAPMTGFKFRSDSPWTAEPIEFLDDLGRVERHGVGFLFSVDDPARDIKARLNVRIKPDLTPGAEINETPYVVVYVVDQTTGADETIKWFHIDIPSSYEKLIDSSIEDWYRQWLEKALDQGKSGKILRPGMRVPEEG